MRNFLEVDAAEFKLATKIFCGRRCKLGPVLLAYESGFLSIESGEATAVMRATGEWHGRATFSPEILRALATVPPVQSPITIAYAEGHLLVSSMTIVCQWNSVSQAFSMTCKIQASSSCWRWNVPSRAPKWLAPAWVGKSAAHA